MEGWISLDAVELRRALAVMSRLVPENQFLSHAGLWKEGPHAVLRIAGVEARIEAEGRWRDVVVTYAGFFLAERERLPGAGSVCLHLLGDRIARGDWSATCWRRASAHDWPEFIDQPRTFDTRTLLDLAFSRDPAELEHSGISHLIRDLVLGRDLWNTITGEPSCVLTALVDAALRHLDAQTERRFEAA